jgi:hypothetical protein
MRAGLLQLLSIVLLLPGGAAAQQAPAQVPAFERVGTISQIMADIIYPASNEIFNVQRGAPADYNAWMRVQRSALMVAESANLLTMPGRAMDQGEWIRAAKLMRDVGAAAYKAAIARDVAALAAMNEQLNESCVACHNGYHPRYRNRNRQ